MKPTENDMSTVRRHLRDISAKNSMAVRAIDDDDPEQAPHRIADMRASLDKAVHALGRRATRTTR